jgi:hypothetical protein
VRRASAWSYLAHPGEALHHRKALAFAFASAGIIAMYTLVDGRGVRLAWSTTMALLRYIDDAVRAPDGIAYPLLVWALGLAHTQLPQSIVTYARRRWPVAALGAAVRRSAHYTIAAVGGSARARRWPQWPALRETSGAVRRGAGHGAAEERFGLQRHGIGTGVIVARCDGPAVLARRELTHRRAPRTWGLRRGLKIEDGLLRVPPRSLRLGSIGENFKELVNDAPAKLASSSSAARHRQLLHRHHLSLMGERDVLLLEQGKLTCGTTGARLTDRPDATEPRHDADEPLRHPGFTPSSGKPTGTWRPAGSNAKQRQRGSTPERMQVLRKQARRAQLRRQVEVISAQQAGELYLAAHR